MNKFLKFLQTNPAVLLATVMSLTPQLWHSVRAFVQLDVGGDSNIWNYFFGILFSVSTSFAILLFTVRGRKKTAYFFLAVEVFINVIHYALMDMNSGPLLYSTLFMCLIVPVTIAVYSSEIDIDEVNDVAFESLPNVNIQAVPSTVRMDGKTFIKEVNDLVGFDITNPKDKSGNVKETSRVALRELWKQKNTLPEEIMKSKIQSILKDDKESPLFKNL